mmetsp:Transcript_18707/g.31274  ORF Transcript_18707/g.31274 Transcript_18707/m.31274 type:complete len:182 (-) Transcript_18707:347-892(-)|eukprot:CAMPEP_0119308918 /NCGR_PEP_ID=MMETSP1333-20130426/12878_1 /TAXON_ID=418940 /ORGANISM="Scyphosphaera apsteinii, Strain RCC1455" /LENGTH=181 /DNA_ID=CAMNT_0007312797 /DNA_START=59 /DNA_END=604 /DNA_ORIENTATION=+
MSGVWMVCNNEEDSLSRYFAQYGPCGNGTAPDPEKYKTPEDKVVWQMFRGNFKAAKNNTAHMQLHMAIYAHYTNKTHGNTVESFAYNVQFAGGFDHYDNFGPGNHDKSLYNAKEFREYMTHPRRLKELFTDEGGWGADQRSAEQEREQLKKKYMGSKYEICGKDLLELAQKLKANAIVLEE